MVKDELRFKGLNENIANEIRSYEYKYFREDKPIPFCGLNIYPVSVRDIEIFSSCVSCLTLNKNTSKEGIRMSHLEFLISKVMSKEEGPEWSFKMSKLFEIIFHIQNGIKCKNCGKVMAYDSPEFTDYLNKIKELTEQKDNDNQEEQQQINIPELLCTECSGKDFVEMIKITKDPENEKKHILLIDGHVIDKGAYDRLRQIVMFQNYPDYCDESWIDADVKADHDAKIELEQKANDVHASTEQKVTCLAVATHFSFEDIYNMSIRRFTMALGAVDDLINYKITKTAVQSGFISLPKGKSIEHWIYKPYKDLYGDAYKSTDSVQAV